MLYAFLMSRCYKNLIMLLCSFRAFDNVTMLHAFDNATMLHAFDNVTMLQEFDNVTMSVHFMLSRCYKSLIMLLCSVHWKSHDVSCIWLCNDVSWAFFCRNAFADFLLWLTFPPYADSGWWYCWTPWPGSQSSSTLLWRG